MSKESINVYQIVTDRIIEELEKGVIPWEKPWSGVISGAFNRISKRPYSIMNQILKNDNKFIVSAASKAEKAVNYIMGGC